jgi:hypothetical protein
MNSKPMVENRSLLARVGRYLESCIAIDSRTLALFRIAVGLIIIADVIVRASTFRFFYTEDGVVPQSLAESRTVDGAFSFFFFVSDPTAIAILFALHAVFAIQLIIGYKTRVATILSFLFVISLDHHNPLILSHADTLFRLLMFWAMFLPLGERWSVDAALRERPPRLSIASLGTTAALLQMLFMYMVNGYHKLQSEMWNSGDATPLIFGLDDMTYFLADFLRQYPTMLAYGGYTWYFMLVSAWIMLFLPGRYRTPVVFAFIIAHASFIITVRIGGFGWVAIAGVLLFLPTAFWDDGKRILERVGMRRATFVDHLHTLHGKTTAIARTFPRLRTPELPDVVTANVYNLVLVFAMFSVFIVPSLRYLNDFDVIDREPQRLEQRIWETSRQFGVHQPQWTVFAPNPRTTDRYYVFAAESTDGELYDVYNDRLLTFDRPFHGLQQQYGNYRERFYMNSIRRAGQHGAPPRHLAVYLCRTWQEERGIELRTINMYVIHERVTLETLTDPDMRHRSTELMSIHGCGDHEAEEIELPDDIVIPNSGS